MALILSGVATSALAADDQITGVDHDAVVKELKQSFQAKGMAKLDRFDQSTMQRECSKASMTGKPLSKEQIAEITKQARASVKLPADGKYLGDWKGGQKIAENGKGRSEEHTSELQ